ncbi:uncharacterized protein [Phyllobates terribilis]|uniref:uncharacterized protein isoform X2 n=1 Tax=Phyllobates terribilis TaxID=111132 RepID=UPI003CCA7CD6
MKPELIGKLIDGGAVPNAGTLLLSLISENMARAKEDLLGEETLPKSRKILLNSNDKPNDGTIYEMYHGTTLESAIQIIQNGFRRSSDGMLGSGVYVTRDREKAKWYPKGDKRDQVILKLRVNVGKVKMIDHQDHPLQKPWHKEGYDTAWVPAYCGMVESGLEEDCIYDPKRIKVIGTAKSPPKMSKYLTLHIKSSQQKKIEKLIQTLKLSFNIEASENMAREIDEKLWQEETLPYFRKILLCSGDKPNDGTIYEMYHGTNLESAILIIQNGFKRSNDDNMLGSGVYVSRDREKAARYPLVGKRYQVILKLRVNVGKVKKIDRQGHPLPKTWHEEGYDTAWVPEDMVESGLEEDCTVYGTQKGSKL